MVLVNVGLCDLVVYVVMVSVVGGVLVVVVLMVVLLVGVGWYGGVWDVFDVMMVWVGCGLDFFVW